MRYAPESPSNAIFLGAGCHKLVENDNLKA